MRVTIRGKTYETVKEAAKALKVHTDTVYCGLSRGDIERIGLGPDYKKRGNGGGGKPPKAVTIGKRTFASMAELARYIGREPRNVRISLRAGERAREAIALAVIKKDAEVEKSLRQKRLNELGEANITGWRYHRK